MILLDDLRKSVIDGDLNAAQDQVNQGLAQRIPPEEILKDGLPDLRLERGRSHVRERRFLRPRDAHLGSAMKGGRRRNAEIGVFSGCAGSFGPNNEEQTQLQRSG